ncbi:MAG TPA: LAGLIDADG family homing endonuclease [Candidatus Nanoarchaeia archaeon]|nr:LAGLIDADG family homing endonuclease [Candidatus Nanoarchaeia archaeon]
MQHAIFSQTEQREFMRDAKNASKLTWEEIASLLGISRAMVFVYLKGTSKIPRGNFLRLCGIAGKNPAVKFVEIFNKEQDIRQIGEMTEEMAEFIGILAGDGSLSLSHHEVAVSGHLKLDEEFMIGRVARLLSRLFGVRVKIKRHLKNNNIRCVVNSKRLSNFLASRFGLPKGKKLGKLHIPQEIAESPKYLSSYLRGLFDTDGSIYMRRKRSLVLSIISKDALYLQEVKKGMEDLGFHPSVSGKNLYLYRQHEIDRFFLRIKPQNRKHLQRFRRLKGSIAL